MHDSNSESRQQRGGDEEERPAWQPPTEDEIRKRAYELYLERRLECGGSLDDWLEAEAELLLRCRQEHS